MATLRGTKRAEELARRFDAAGLAYTGIYDSQYGGDVKNYYVYFETTTDTLPERDYGHKARGFCLHFKGIDQMDAVTADPIQLAWQAFKVREAHHCQRLNREDAVRTADRAEDYYGRSHRRLMALRLGRYDTPMYQAKDSEEGLANTEATDLKRWREAIAALHAVDAELVKVLGQEPTRPEEIVWLR